MTRTDMTSTHTLTFHTADTPNGHKIGIYLEEAGLTSELAHMNLSAGEQRSRAFLAINPNGKIPAIVDHGTGLAVFESGAILGYLSAKTGCLHPETLAERTAAQRWLHFRGGGRVRALTSHRPRRNDGAGSGGCPAAKHCSPSS
ncbi:glutathione S-transferase N-terminal domain-containing protein [Burkholderia anthina]|uniref:glutathione S-transferase N-terminal domain-containing protein n=1 Tax=Burkholderia anthina TaxID=179879 RepID=UPI0021BC04DE